MFIITGTVLTAVGTILNVIAIKERRDRLLKDDNGHPYRTNDGGYIPNNDYDIDGIHYETDDNGSIYRADGKYYPDDTFQLNGTWYSTDENGTVTTDEINRP